MFAKKLRDAFPDIAFKTIGELRAKEDWVAYEWEGVGTHTGPAFNDFLIGPMPEASGQKIQLSGFTIVKLVDGKIVEEAIWSKERQGELERVGKWFL